MPRYKTGPTVKEITISLPFELLEKLDLKLTNPITGQLMYGGRSAIIRRLLYLYLHGEIKLPEDKSDEQA